MVMRGGGDEVILMRMRVMRMMVRVMRMMVMRVMMVRVMRMNPLLHAEPRPVSSPW